MATPTYTELLAQNKEAMKQILLGAQSYKVGPRELTRANLGEIRQNIGFLENLVARESDPTAGLGLCSFGGPV